MSDEIKNPNTEEEYQPDLMTLEDEDGNEVTFEVIDALDHKGVHYLAVVEYTENEEDAEDAQLVILSVGEDDEGEYLDVVEDDETLLEVSKLFEQRLSAPVSAGRKTGRRRRSFRWQKSSLSLPPEAIPGSWSPWTSSFPR